MEEALDWRLYFKTESNISCVGVGYYFVSKVGQNITLF